MKRLSGAVPEYIMHRVARAKGLEQALGAALPDACVAHCRLGTVRDGTAIVIADSPAWRARIAYYRHDILSQINRLSNVPVQRVEIRVGRAVTLSQRPPPPRPPAGLPPSAARGFASLAEDTADPELRAVLRRLARRGDAADEQD